MVKPSSKITLKEVPLFSELSVNDFIFHEGDEFKGLFIVLKGSIKIEYFFPQNLHLM